MNNIVIFLALTISTLSFSNICKGDRLTPSNYPFKYSKIKKDLNKITSNSFLKKFESLFLTQETHLFNIYSISAKSYYPNTVSYTTSEYAKKAMIGVIEKEWSKYGIRFSNFYVGAIDTPLWEDYSEMDKDKMLTITEFIYMFNSVVDAPKNIKFSELTFLNKDSFID